MSARRRKCPVERRTGGWFVIDEVRGWSGPWGSEAAAIAAREDDYDKANRLHKEATK